MFQNKWVSSSVELPTPGVIVNADVKGFGHQKMILVLDQKMKRNCAFNPMLWKEKSDEYCWEQIDGDFMCKLDLVKSWKHEPKNTHLHNIR